LADFVIGLAKGLYTGHQQRLSKLIHNPVRISRGQWPLKSRRFLSSALWKLGSHPTGTTDPGWQANVFRQSATALGVSDNDIVRVGREYGDGEQSSTSKGIYRWRI
jgi:hypothetical protein